MNTIEDLRIAKHQLYEAIRNIQNFATTNYDQSMIENVREYPKFEFYITLCEDYFDVCQELEHMEYIKEEKDKGEGCP
jgi:hypothetical protein